MNYGIRVQIGSLVIGASWNAIDPAIIDDLEIVWGRQSLQAQPSPAELTIGLLDPDGRYGSDPNLIGAQIRIFLTGRAAGDRLVFRGSISDVAMKRQNTTTANEKDPVYVATLTAIDPMADVARSVTPGDFTGPSSNPYGIDPYDMATKVISIGGWLPDDWPTTLANLWSRSATLRAIVAAIDSVPTMYSNAQGSGVRWWLVNTGFEANERVTDLNLLQLAYRVVAADFVHAVYKPEDNSIRRVGMAHGGAVALVLVSNVIKLSIVPTSGAVVQIDADKIGVPDGYKLESTVAESIDTVTLNIDQKTTMYSTTGVPQSLDKIAPISFSANSTHYNPALYGVRAYVIDGVADVWAAPQAPSPPSPVGDFAGQQLVYDVRNIANKVNGVLRLPKLRYEFRRFPPADDTIADLLLTLYDQNIAAYFQGSVFSDVPQVPQQVQIIGGTVGYREKGWFADFDTAPALDAVAGNLTIGQLVTNPTPTLGQYDPAIAISDWGNVSIGLA